MLAQLLTKVVSNHTDKTAIVCDNLTISYRELYSKIKSFKKGLSSIGIGQGDCVVLLLPNCLEFVIGFYATAFLNGIVLPLNHLFKAEEISYYLDDSNAKAIVTDFQRADICLSILSKLDKKIELIVVDDSQFVARYFKNSVFPETTEIDESWSRYEGNFLYQYSSGSTGRPKRVCRTQKNLYHEVKNFSETVKLTSSDNILCIVPLCHAHGLGNCLLAATLNGSKLVILEQTIQNGVNIKVPFVFKYLRIFELIKVENITIFPGIPYIFKTIVETSTISQADLSNIRLCFSAGNFLEKCIFDLFFKKFGVPIRQLYGCTEAGSISINLDQNIEKTWNSVGTNIKNVEIKIVDEQARELPRGKTGEIAIKSKALTNGYYKMIELNQQTFKDGLFLTGDLGNFDESGYLYITGRKKILIDTGGRKVDPIEIENILSTHPQVEEAVVVGVKGIHTGEIIKAVIVVKEPRKCDEQEIFSYCKERLAEFKVPKVVEFRDEIPKSISGKILRKALL